MQAFKKIVRPCKVNLGNDERSRFTSVFCKIEFDGAKLSISGVVGPRPSGNAAGGCGQIDMEFAHRNPADDDKRYSKPIKPSNLRFAPGWNRDKWFGFLDIWRKWHLNDMRAGCEHQRGPEWESREITLYYFRLRKSVIDARRTAEKRAKAVLKTGETFTTTAEETRVCTLPDSLTLTSAELPANLVNDYEPNGPQYPNDHYNKPSEVKQSTWVRQSEHPDGLLSKPCPVCGYKYGSAWKSEAVPADVIEFLKSLPDTDEQPAWV